MAHRAVYWVSFSLLLFSFNLLLAQKKIVKGQVKSDTRENLEHASVIVIDSSSTILAFSITDEKGEFTLEIPVHSPVKLWIEARFLGYKKQRIGIEPETAYYQFELPPDEEILREVIVKNRPTLKRLGDTLRYAVTNFAQPEDRSVGDVLRRMPGIDIGDDGTIYYNGKPIENLYIHGDDLMNGRYGLATKAIRKEDIKAIDVIRNHQPIKVLQNKIFTNKTAINLILKDENKLKLSTQLMTGGGLPQQYDAAVTPIVLNKNIKMINTLALNNSGTDYKNDFKQLGASNFISNIGTDPADFSLALGTAGPPDLPVPTYYFNRSKLVDLNNLYNTQNGVQFKVNIQGYWDRSSMDYSSTIDNFTSTDTITYNETQELIKKPMLLHTSFNIMANKKHYFLNNNVKINLHTDDNHALMHFNENTFLQNLDKNQYEISNDFNWIPQLQNNKGIGEIRWLINYNNNRQKLRIGEGYHMEIADQEGNYDTVVQSLQIPTLFSNAYISYKIPNKRITQQYKLGYINEHQKFNTTLNFERDQQSFPYHGDAGNHVKWNRQNLYASATYELRYKNWQSIVSLPLAYQTIRYSQEDYHSDSKNNHFIFSPNLKVQYNLNIEERLNISYGHHHTFGNITDVFQGAVLKNYRILQANQADLQKRKEDAFRLGYHFEKSASLFFMNAGFNYNKSISNTIFSTQITDGIQNTIMLPIENAQSSYGFNLGLSKYVFALGSTFSLKSEFNTTSFRQIINDKLIPFHTRNFSLSSKFDKKLFGQVRLLYRPHAFWINSTLDTQKEKRIQHTTFRLDQSIELQFTPFQLWEFEINAKHSLTHQKNNKNRYLFSGAKIRRHFKNAGVDVSFDVTNLFNVKDYKLYSIANNQLIRDRYRLRGRMILLRLDWYF